MVKILGRTIGRIKRTNIWGRLCILWIDKYMGGVCFYSYPARVGQAIEFFLKCFSGEHKDQGSFEFLTGMWFNSQPNEQC